MHSESDPVTLGSFRGQCIVKYTRDFSEKTKHFKSYYLQAELYNLVIKNSIYLRQNYLQVSKI